MSRIYDVTTSGLAKGVVSRGLGDILKETGQMPPIELVLKPLNGAPSMNLNRFLEYKFNSNIITPVDSFSFTFAAPDDPRPPSSMIKSGDLVQLRGNGTDLTSGMVDQVAIQTYSDESEFVTIAGRDILCQLEDNDAIDVNNKPIFFKEVGVTQACQILFQNTRIPTNVQLNNTGDLKGILATEPGETKLSALQRFLEPLNMVLFLRGNGTPVVGKPSFNSGKKGDLFCLKSGRSSNILDIKVTRAETMVANTIVGIWSGQEQVQDRKGIAQVLYNPLEGPNRLRQLKHKVIKTVVVSASNAGTPQGAGELTTLLRSGGGGFINAYAKRELARQNVNAIQVQIKVQGHYNAAGEPYLVDTVYNIQFERGEVNQNMYLFEVEYSLSQSEGQISLLNFCSLNCIVAD